MNSDHDYTYCSIHDFVTAELEGTATDQQRRSFEELIRVNSVARELYVTYMQEQVSLRWTFSSNPNDLLEHSEGDVSERSLCTSAFDKTAAEIDSSTKRRRLSRFSFMLAACLLIGIGWTAAQWFGSAGIDRTTSNSNSIGVIVNLDEVKWDSNSAEFAKLSRITEGERICFNSGVLDLMLSTGTEIMIEGPADLTLDSDMKASVKEGKLVVHCGPDAVGFEIESPDATVIDLGTTFGVSVVDEQRTDIAVYDGAVDLAPSKVGDMQNRRLTAGEAIHVSRHGVTGRISLLPNDRLLLPRTLASPQRLPQIISSVRDNLRVSETSKYYRIVRGGFSEDCPAFVDRDHQWNGINEIGVPSFLQGGDYVMTFNDDKVRRVIIEVDLAAPASLFLLLDNRVSIPEWIGREFIDTGWDVGLDESYDDREHIKNDEGPGKSIDQTFSVWRKDCHEAMLVKLHPIVSENIEVDPRAVEICMYGIVATELIESSQL